MSAARTLQSRPLRHLSKLSEQCPRPHRYLHATSPASHTVPVVSHEPLPAIAVSPQVPRAVASEAPYSSFRPVSRIAASTPATRRFGSQPRSQSATTSPTIDAAYFPSSEGSPVSISDAERQSLLSRVPIIREILESASKDKGLDRGAGYDVPVMKAEISSNSLNSIVIPIAENSDGGGPDLGFAAFGILKAAPEWYTKGGQRAAKTEEVKVEGKERGAVGRVWDGLVEDVLGKKQ